MRKKPLLIGFLLLAAVLALAFFALAATVKWVQALNAPVAAAFVTAIVGLAGLLYAQWQSKGRDIAESHRNSKIEVYNNFLDIVEKFQDKDGASLTGDDGEAPAWLKRDFAKLNRGLILWASPDVIRAWLSFRTASTTGENILVAVDKMYQAIRKDLGNSNFGLQSGDLIKLGLSDPDEWKS